MGFLFCFFFKEQKPVSFQNTPKNGYKKTKNPGRLGFIKKTGFSQPSLSFNHFL